MSSSALFVTFQTIARTDASTKKGSLGMPGNMPIANMAPAAIKVAFGRPVICPIKTGPRLEELVSFVTSTPAAVEMNSAGICDTRPSPIVSMEYVSKACPIELPFMVAIVTPPIRFNAVMIKPAIASPRTNLDAPSMAP